MKPIQLSLPIKISLFAVAYLAAVFAASWLSFPTSKFSALWMPGGLTLAVLLLTKAKHWPLYLLAALPGQMFYTFFLNANNWPLLVGIVYYISICIEAIIGAWLVYWFNSHQSSRLRTPKDVSILVFCAILISTAISATINTGFRFTLESLSFWDTWRVAWFGHAQGVLAVAPVLLAWSHFKFTKTWFTNPEYLIQAVLLYTGLVITSVSIVGSNTLFMGPGYLILPFLVWAALSFGTRGISIGGLITAIIAYDGIIHRLGGIAHDDNIIANQVTGMGSYYIITTITCFVLAAVWQHAQETSTQLSRSEERFRRLIENQGEGIGIVNDSEIFSFTNPAANQIFGIYPDTLVGRSLREFTSEHQYDILLTQTHLRQRGMKSSYELEIIRPGGEVRSLLVTATPEYNENRHVTGTFAIFRDITERKKAENALQESQARFQTIFDHSPIPIWEEDFSSIKHAIDAYRAQGILDFREFFTRQPDKVRECQRLIRILNVNEAALQLMGAKDKQQFLSDIAFKMGNNPLDIFTEQLIAIAEEKKEFESEGPNDIANGEIRHHRVWWSVAPGYEQDYSLVIVSIVDITESKQTEERLRFLSTHDLLTDLYNRNFFEAELERLQDSRQTAINIMVIDVNGMKTANDSYGHEAGDDLLRRTAQVLKTSFRKEDIIARIGGDEFVVLFTGAISDREAIRRVQECLEEHNQKTNRIALSLSIGATTCTGNDSLQEAFKKADQEMYQNKALFHKGMA